MKYSPRIGRDPEVPELLEPREDEGYISGLGQEYYDQLGSETYDKEDLEPSYPSQEEYEQLGAEI